MGAPTGSTIDMKNSWHWQSQAERRPSFFEQLGYLATSLRLQVVEDEEQEHKDRERLGSATRKKSEKNSAKYQKGCICFCNAGAQAASAVERMQAAPDFQTEL